MSGLNDIALINAISRKTIKEDEVYTFALRLCDNDIDRDFERFDDSTLEVLSHMFVGKSGIFNHKCSTEEQTARIYRAEVIDDAGIFTSDGRPRRFIKGWAYMMRTPENADIIAEIDEGIKREISVGCSVERVLCSICGEPIDECQHKKGTVYDGKMCHGLLVGAKEAYEWAFVTKPTKKTKFGGDNMTNINRPENMKLADTIILNGIIGCCDTHDENSETIGVKVVQKVRRLNGDVVETVVDSFPFTKEMCERCGWLNRYASIQMLTGSTPIDVDHIDETKIVSMMGEVESEYYHSYSDYTGYLWTTEMFKCGGHDIPQILRSHIGEYIHMEIELYEKVR